MPLIKLSERSSHVQNGFVYRLVVLSGFKKEAEKYYYQGSITNPTNVNDKITFWIPYFFWKSSIWNLESMMMRASQVLVFCKCNKLFSNKSIIF